ncbi:MAG: macro domain-containing protein [Marinilabiliales bacterium]|nr:MAG: macro domain-containing protein [Marinilabiliales bacterium]
MEKTVSGVTIELVRGDIASQPDIGAVVNAANAQLRIGGGVAGAIHRAAGPGLEKECLPFAPIRPGEAVITGAHKLPNDYVIHCLGPVYGRDKPESGLLSDCYRNALGLAEKNRIESVAFPAISAGAFGYPLNDAAEVALNTIFEVSSGLKHVKKIRFVLFAESDLEAFGNVISSLNI